MMISQLISVLLGLFLFSTAVDAEVEESLQLKVFNRDYRATDEQMHALLQRANLTGHGYKNETTTKLVSEPGSKKTLFKKSIFYYKIVDCTRMLEIDQELQKLLPDALGKELLTKVKSEIKTKNLTKMKRCKVGLEVHFKEAEGCFGKKNKTRRHKRGCGGWCFICFSATLS